MSDRPIEDAREQLRKLRDSELPREVDAVIDVVRGDVENVRRLIERAQAHAKAGSPSDVDALEDGMERDLNTLGDEIGAILSGVIDELSELQRPTTDGAPAQNTSPTTVLEPDADAAQLSVVHISSSDPEHAKIRRERLPSSVIVVDETYVYTTDEQSRVVRTEATLTLRPPAHRNKRAQRYLEGKLPGDDAGHLIARVLGGIGNELNLVPMERYQVNKGEYRAVEEHWEEAVKQGKTVYVTIEIDYDDTGPRPTDFFVTYEIDGEMYWSEIANPLPEGQN